MHRVISLGPSCLVALHLKNCHVSGPSLPFDWIRARNHGAGMAHVHTCLANRFEGYMDDPVLVAERVPGISPRITKIQKYPNVDYIHHDVRKLEMQETMKRRARRFLDLLANQDPAELVFVFAVKGVNPKEFEENSRENTRHYLPLVIAELEKLTGLPPNFFFVVSDLRVPVPNTYWKQILETGVNLIFIPGGKNPHPVQGCIEAWKSLIISLLPRPPPTPNTPPS